MRTASGKIRFHISGTADKDELVSLFGPEFFQELDKPTEEDSGDSWHASLVLRIGARCTNGHTTFRDFIPVACDDCKDGITELVATMVPKGKPLSEVFE